MSDDEPKESKPVVARTLLDIQRIKLEKLMKNPDKAVLIPEKPKERGAPIVPDFVRNVMGSSAGAGSGEFHVYRHLRRKEYARQHYMSERAKWEKLESEYHDKIQDNKRKAEEETAKKRAKRLRKKRNKKKPQKKAVESSSSSESDPQSDDDEQPKNIENPEINEQCKDKEKPKDENDSNETCNLDDKVPHPKETSKIDNKDPDSKETCKVVDKDPNCKEIDSSQKLLNSNIEAPEDKNTKN